MYHGILDNCDSFALLVYLYRNYHHRYVLLPLFCYTSIVHVKLYIFKLSNRIKTETETCPGIFYGRHKRETHAAA